MNTVKKLMFQSRCKYSVVIIIIIVSIIILCMPSGLLSQDTNGGKMAFAAASAVRFPLLEIEQKLPLVTSVSQTTSSLIVQYITAAGQGAVCEQCQFIVYKPLIINERPVIAYASETPFDLSGAKKIVFFAKGELGGETIKALAIGKSPDLVSTPALNALQFEVVSPNIVLTTDWKRYELSVDGVDLKDVSSPFGLVISNQRGSTPTFPGPDSDKPPINNGNVKEVSFYLKGVSIDNTPADNPINIVGSQLLSPNIYGFTLPLNIGTSVIPMPSYSGR
jgi:hypothetical protein